MSDFQQCQVSFPTSYSSTINLMRAAVKQMDLSARAYHRVLKIARTITDIAGEETLGPQHLTEALQ